jgi:hypothetical protein
MSDLPQLQHRLSQHLKQQLQLMPASGIGPGRQADALLSRLEDLSLRLSDICPDGPKTRNSTPDVQTVDNSLDMTPRRRNVLSVTRRIDFDCNISVDEPAAHSDWNRESLGVQEAIQKVKWCIKVTAMMSDLPQLQQRLSQDLKQVCNLLQGLGDMTQKLQRNIETSLQNEHVLRLQVQDKQKVEEEQKLTERMLRECDAECKKLLHEKKAVQDKLDAALVAVEIAQQGERQKEEMAIARQELLTAAEREKADLEEKVSGLLQELLVETMRTKDREKQAEEEKKKLDEALKTVESAKETARRQDEVALSRKRMLAAVERERDELEAKVNRLRREHQAENMRRQDRENENLEQSELVLAALRLQVQDKQKVEEEQKLTERMLRECDAECKKLLHEKKAVQDKLDAALMAVNANKQADRKHGAEAMRERDELKDKIHVLSQELSREGETFRGMAQQMKSCEKTKQMLLSSQVLVQSWVDESGGVTRSEQWGQDLLAFSFALPIHLCQSTWRLAA